MGGSAVARLSPPSVRSGRAGDRERAPSRPGAPFAGGTPRRARDRTWKRRVPARPDEPDIRHVSIPRTIPVLTPRTVVRFARLTKPDRPDRGIRDTPERAPSFLL